MANLSKPLSCKDIYDLMDKEFDYVHCCCECAKFCIKKGQIPGSGWNYGVCCATYIDLLRYFHGKEVFVNYLTKKHSK
jgi:hypothetical protein